MTTIIFALLAAFVVWKLRSVLGTRNGSEKPPFNPFARRAPGGLGPRAGDPARDSVNRVIPLPGAAEPPVAVAPTGGNPMPNPARKCGRGSIPLPPPIQTLPLGLSLAAPNPPMK